MFGSKSKKDKKGAAASAPTPAPAPAPAPANYGATSQMSPVESKPQSTLKSSQTLNDRQFFNEMGYGWDVVMVFPTEGPTEPREDGKTRRTYNEMLKKLAAAGLDTYAYFSVQKDEVYVKIRANLDRLQQQADALNYSMELDKDKLKAAASRGFPKFNIGPLKLSDDKRICKYDPYDMIYAKYDTDDLLKPLFKHAPGMNHAFGSIQRIKIIGLIIEGSTSLSGCEINIDKCLEVGDILQYFPLHDPVAAKALEAAYCKTQLPSSQPNDMLRDYFGEKVALFFVFLCHYTTWCAYLAIVGLGVTVNTLVELSTDTIAAESFAIFVTIWAVCMMEYWKQTEATTAMKWGMSEFESAEEDRPEFRGEVVASPIDGNTIRYYPEAKRTHTQRLSMFVTFINILIVMAFIGFVMLLKGWPGNWSTYSSIINSIGIQIFNTIYNKMARKLTNMENYRTDTHFEDSLILKLFFFQFVNSFASLYYIAFIQVYVFDVACDYGSCMNDLCISVGIIFATNLIVQNMTSWLQPKIMTAINKHNEGASDGGFSVPELQYMMMPYEASLDTIDAYMNIARQFGYMILFVVAFPAAPFLCYLSNYAQLRMDAHKFLNTYQRIMPSGAQDIGSWQTVFTMITGAAIITNAAIAVFVMDTFDGVKSYLGLSYFRVWMFILFQYFLFGIMAFFSLNVADVPVDVTTQLGRAAFINEKVILKVADEEESAEIEQRMADLKINERNDGR